MPLVELNSSKNGHIIGLFRISESSDELFDMLNLNPEEEQLYSAYSHEEKKQEWCAARLLVASICESAGITYSGMHKNGDGKPILNGSSSEISISHSYPYVAAIWHKTDSVGIDLEQPKEKLIRIGPRFLNDTEIESAGNNMSRICIYWCAKETLYKIFSKRGLIFRTDLEVTPKGDYPWPLLEGKINRGKGLTYELAVTVNDEFILVHNA